MDQHIGLDVSLKDTSIAVRQDGKRIWRGKCASDAKLLAEVIRKRAPHAKRVVFETGPLSVWFYHALIAEGLPAICIDARHAKAALDMAANKTDANDADGLAQLAEVGFYREVRVKGFDSMLMRTLITARRQLMKMRVQMSNQIRGLMKTFGLVVPKGAGSVFERNVLTLLEGEDDLARIILPLLKAWSDIRVRVAELTKQLVTMAGTDQRCRLLTSVRGVGTVILGATGRRERGAPRPELRLYNDEMDSALVTLWEASDRVCGKRLHAMLPLLVEAMERHGHMTLLPAIRAGILTMSAATIDRRLAPFREGAKRRRRAPPSAAVKAAVPVRTFADWGDPLPGFFEADLVAHSSPSADGRFVQTLTLTDIASGWTETVPIPFREQGLLVQALVKLQRSLPMPILGLDTDNDTVFMNESIQGWCAVHDITFTRSRPYHKNDQAWVEQKNGSVARKLVGYRQYEGLEALQILEKLYAASRMFVNLLQPSFKLISKERRGAKVIKRYDKPVTPCQRLLADARVSNAIKTRLSTMQASLDPIDLLARMRHCQQQLLNLSQEQQVEGAIQPDARLGDFLASLKDAWQFGNLKEPARPLRNWRTRADPFAATATEVTALFESAMGRTSRDLFEKLCADHPGLYLPGQLRTFERQRKRWRAAKADALILGASAVAAE